jgi:hypothetical protein
MGCALRQAYCLGRPYRGFHVPHRQVASGELASRRREPGTIPACSLTMLAFTPGRTSQPHASHSHYDASTKASLAFNSTPTFPGIDFRYGSLLSFCVYGLLETPRLLATPRPYGNRRLVLAWSDWFRHLTYATSCRTSELRTSGRLLDNNARFLLGFTENETTLLLTVSENQLTIIEKSLQTSGSAHIY